MKSDIERRPASGIKDYFALAVTTFGVGYLPLAPGTWGSMVGVAIYLVAGFLDAIWNHHWSVEHNFGAAQAAAIAYVFTSIALLILSLVGIWGANRSTELFGNADPSQAVVDEVIGQLITFCFIPFTTSWKLILAGFLLFRVFDIWKPYPIDSLQSLPAGLGVCADDVLAGVYAGICLTFIYALSFSL
jgi:phosphatidylglycerophosphatase A